MELGYDDHLMERLEAFVTGVIELAKENELPLRYTKFGMDEAYGRMESAIVVRDESLDDSVLRDQANSIEHALACNK